MKDCLPKPLLLHSCCAPCTILPLDLLRQSGYQPVAFFYNPNIQPPREYQKRLDTLQSYAAKADLELLVEAGDSELWWERVGSLGGPYLLVAGSPNYAQNRQLRQQRCAACYQLRLQKLAQVARERGFAQISTTLLLSPYQDTALLQTLLQHAAAAAGLQAHGPDWREHYPEARRRSTQLALYSQNFCGCSYSRTEAKCERTARRAQAKLRRRQEQAASALAAQNAQPRHSDADSGL